MLTKYGDLSFFSNLYELAKPAQLPPYVLKLFQELKKEPTPFQFAAISKFVELYGENRLSAVVQIGPGFGKTLIMLSFALFLKRAEKSDKSIFFFHCQHTHDRDAHAFKQILPGNIETRVW